MTHELNPIGPNDRNAWRASDRFADLTRPDRPVRRVSVGARPKPFAFDAARAGLIVVDMQNDFCHPDGWLAGIGVDVTPARACIEPLAALLPVARAAGLPVIWVNWGNRPDLANISPALAHVYDATAAGTGLGAPLGPRRSPVLEKGAWSAEVVDELEPAPDDLRVDKHRMSGFWDTPLDAILRNLRIDTLFFGGVNADQCVLHTLADANFLGYDTVLIEDGTATTSPAFCMEATLYNVRQIFGFTVTTADLIPSLSGASP
ncbi:MAG: cysteine hydrolase family protein [Roseicyclus sp.]